MTRPRPVGLQNRNFLPALGAVVILGASAQTAAAHARLPTTGPIIYTVSSNCSASITYIGNGGTTEHQSGIHFGWSREVNPGRLASISARASCAAAQVEVTIERNGHVFKDAKAKGDYVTADARVTFR